MINNKFGKIFWTLALLSTAVGADAEVAYVTDQLRLGVHQAEDTSDRAFEFLKSADKVEVLEQNKFYARVEISDGRRGWVRKTYLVEEPPAILRVALVEQERDNVISQLETLQSRLGQQKSLLNDLERKIASYDADSESEKNELIELRVANVELEQSLGAYRFSVPGTWFLVLTVIFLAGGFVSGWWWLDRRTRLRHGGFRLY